MPTKSAKIFKRKCRIFKLAEFRILVQQAIKLTRNGLGQLSEILITHKTTKSTNQTEIRDWGRRFRDMNCHRRDMSDAKRPGCCWYLPHDLRVTSQLLIVHTLIGTLRVVERKHSLRAPPGNLETGIRRVFCTR